MKASGLLSDGSSSGGLPNMSTFFAAILVVVMGVGFKFYKDKQAGKGGAGAQQPAPMVEINPAAASSSQPGAPPPPPGGGYGGASPWMEQRDPTTGAAYYYNTQTG